MTSKDVNDLLAWVAGCERLITRNMNERINVKEIDYFLNYQLPVKYANLPSVRSLYDRIYWMKQVRKPSKDLDKTNGLVAYVRRVIGTVTLAITYKEDEDVANQLLDTVRDTLTDSRMDVLIGTIA